MRLTLSLCPDWSLSMSAIIISIWVPCPRLQVWDYRFKSRCGPDLGLLNYTYCRVSFKQLCSLENKYTKELSFCFTCSYWSPVFFVKDTLCLREFHYAADIFFKKSYRDSIDKIEYKWILIEHSPPSSERRNSIIYFPSQKTKGNKDIDTDLDFLFLQNLKEGLHRLKMEVVPEVKFSINKTQKNINVAILLT